MYTPSTKDVGLIIKSCGDYSGKHLALPGNWSPKLFVHDLFTYPVQTKELLCNCIYNSCINNKTYLEFFVESRDKDRPINEKQLEWFQIFNRGSIMLYFETIFLMMLDDITGNKIILNESQYVVISEYMTKLSRAHIYDWNDILKPLGACCYQFFAKEPLLYINNNSEEFISDTEMLNKCDEKLMYNDYPDKISINDSRTKLILFYNTKLLK